MASIFRFLKSEELLLEEIRDIERMDSEMKKLGSENQDLIERNKKLDVLISGNLSD